MGQSSPTGCHHHRQDWQHAASDVAQSRSRFMDYRWTSPASAWLSLSHVPGHLLVQVLDASAKALTAAARNYPVDRRTLPSGSDWLLQANLHRASRPFGTHLPGLQLETADPGTTD